MHVACAIRHLSCERLMLVDNRISFLQICSAMFGDGNMMPISLSLRVPAHVRQCLLRCYRVASCITVAHFAALMRRTSCI